MRHLDEQGHQSTAFLLRGPVTDPSLLHAVPACVYAERRLKALRRQAQGLCTVLTYYRFMADHFAGVQGLMHLIAPCADQIRIC